MSKQVSTYAAVLSLLILSRTIQPTKSTCVKFTFLNLTEETVTRSENSTLSLLFKTDSLEKCNDWTLLQNMTISVSKAEEGSTMPGTACEYRLQDFVCIQAMFPNISCECNNNVDKLYRFQKRVNWEDNGNWIWSAKPKGIAETKELTFNITYPGQVRSLHLRDQSDREIISAVDEGTALKMLCFWDVGNPPTNREARLVDRHGEEMDVQRITHMSLKIRQIRHEFHGVKCDDSGVFRCEISRHNQSRSVTMLVRCPPEITLLENEIDVLQGASVVLRANVRSHTDNFSECSVEKVFRSEHSRGPQECHLADLTGRPPYLTLTIQLDNMQEEEDGEWRLYIANDVGRVSADFKLIVAESSVTFPVAIASGVAALAAVIGFTAVVLMAYRFSKRRKVVISEVPGIQLRDDDGSTQRPTYQRRGSSHIYDEAVDVPDLPVASK